MRLLLLPKTSMTQCAIFYWFDNMKFFLNLATFVLALCSAQSALAQGEQVIWPSKPLRFLVAAPAGSSLDVIARSIERAWN